MSPLIHAQFLAAGVFLAVAFSHTLISARQPGPKVHLLFALTAFGAAANALAEAFFYRATTIESFNAAFRWSNNLNGFWLVALIWFIVAYTAGPDPFRSLGSIRRWSAVVLSAIFLVAVIANNLMPFGFLYLEISDLSPVVLPWGERIVIAHGTSNPWRILTDLAFVGIIGLTLDGTARLSRRGEQRSAQYLGGSLLVFLVLLLLFGFLVDLGILEIPYLYTWGYLAVALAMSYQLAGDVVRASTLAAEVKGNERRWRSLLENVQLLVAGVDKDGRVDYVNPYFTAVTGYAAREAIGQPIGVLAPAGDGERGGWMLSEGLAGPVETTLRTKSGETRQVVLRSVHLRAPSGDVTGILSVGADITERVKAEAARDEALRDTRKALQQVEKLKRRLEDEVVYLKSEITTAGRYGDIVGESDSLQYVMQKVEEVAPLDTTVLIEGETGAGKELIARAIHDQSPRRKRSLVKVNCAALPASLIEAELFGHERGAFTGATRLRKGRFEIANGGTLFLDEIGELPLDLQGKLLRVLEEGEVERVGSESTIRVDVRIIAATNRNLKVEVDEQRFREDLYYRLHVYPITVPALRQRRRDIPLLVNAFVQRFARTQGKAIDQVPQPVMDELMAYDWPGNVRELENVIERAVVTARGNELRLTERLLPAKRTSGHDGDDYRGSLEHVERAYIGRILELSEWRIEGRSGAAELLGLHPNTLRFRMRKLGIRRPAKSVEP